MKTIMRELLKTWCGKLIDLQITDQRHLEFDGGILCPACGLIHGRCGDAMYPMVYMYRSTGDAKYLNCAEKLFDWTRNNVYIGDGAIVNDVGIHNWKGITVFTAMQLAEILLHHKDVLDDNTYQRWFDACLGYIDYLAKVAQSI